MFVYIFTLYKIPGMSIGDHSNEIQGCSELFFQAWRHMTDFPKTEIQYSNVSSQFTI